MKKALAISIFFFVALPGFGQDHIAIIAEKSCQCMEKISTNDEEEFTMQLGLCMIEAATPYKKQLKKEHNIDLDNIETEGEKLGRMVGMKMATVCPDILIKMTQKVKGGEQQAEASLETVSGTVTKVENDFFVTFSLKDDAGKISKYHWLTFVDSEADLINSYTTLTGKSVTVSYQVLELFDPRIKEYRQFFVIKKLDLKN